MKQFAPCLGNDFGEAISGDDVLPGLVYESLGKGRGALRIVEESGEDFLYPAKHFLLLSDAYSAQLERSLLAAA